MSDAQEKNDRVIKTLNHEEPDRVPVGEFFWTNFVRRCRSELDVGDDFDPYRYWDLDMVVLTANMDPHITGIDVLEDSARRKLVRTGFGATIERLSTLPMPHFAAFEHESWEAIEALEFDDPYDPRRYFEPIDDQINSDSIYLRKLPDGRHCLFSYFEYVGEDFAADGAKMAADPETQRWWDVCKPCHKPLPDRAEGEWWADMEEVFHQD